MDRRQPAADVGDWGVAGRPPVSARPGGDGRGDGVVVCRQLSRRNSSRRTSPHRRDRRRARDDSARAADRDRRGGHSQRRAGCARSTCRPAGARPPHECSCERTAILSARRSAPASRRSTPGWFIGWPIAGSCWWASTRHRSIPSTATACPRTARWLREASPGSRGSGSGASRRAITSWWRCRWPLQARRRRRCGQCCGPTLLRRSEQPGAWPALPHCLRSRPGLTGRERGNAGPRHGNGRPVPARSAARSARGKRVTAVGSATGTGTGTMGTGAPQGAC